MYTMWESAVCVQAVWDEMREADEAHMVQPPTGLMQPGAGLMLQCAGLVQPVPGVEKSDATPTCGEYKYNRQWRP
jgi:hypothetical protein